MAQYDIGVVGEDRFVRPPPALAEVVMIEIVDASLSGNDSDNANFISTLRTTIPTLRAAGITSISCGSISSRSNVIHLNYAISKNIDYYNVHDVRTGNLQYNFLSPPSQSIPSSIFPSSLGTRLAKSEFPATLRSRCYSGGHSS